MSAPPGEALTASMLGGLSVLLFALAVALIFSGAGFILWQLILRKFGSGPAPSDRWTHVLLRRVTLALAVAGVLCIAYGRFVEPVWPETTRIRIPSPHLAGDKKPIRIVQISDLHSDPVARLETRLPGIIAAESPDLIAFTGDSMNSLDSLPVFKECLSAIARIAPVYAVRGNWDIWQAPGLDLFTGTGAHELDGTPALVDIRGTTICLAGIPFGGEGRLSRALAACPPDTFRLLLYHSPDLMPEAVSEGVNLFLAGHTHGGQVAMPFYGALITLSKFGKKYESGLFHEGPTWMYVNRGIGMEGGGAPRVRFCSRPEVAVIDLVPE